MLSGRLPKPWESSEVKQRQGFQVTLSEATNRSMHTTIILREQGLYCSLWHQQAAPGTCDTVFMATAILGSEGSQAGKLKYNNALSPNFRYFLFFKCSPGCCKFFAVRFERSENFDYDSFCQLNHCFTREMEIWKSLLCYFFGNVPHRKTLLAI